jgi:hypothetical protein
MIPPLLVKAVINEIIKRSAPITAISNTILSLRLPALLLVFGFVSASLSLLLLAGSSSLLRRALTELSIGVFLIMDESTGDL